MLPVELLLWTTWFSAPLICLQPIYPCTLLLAVSSWRALCVSTFGSKHSVFSLEDLGDGLGMVLGPDLCFNLCGPWLGPSLSTYDQCVSITLHRGVVWHCAHLLPGLPALALPCFHRPVATQHLIETQRQSRWTGREERLQARPGAALCHILRWQVHKMVTFPYEINASSAWDIEVISNVGNVPFSAKKKVKAMILFRARRQTWEGLSLPGIPQLVWKRQVTELHILHRKGKCEKPPGSVHESELQDRCGVGMDATQGGTLTNSNKHTNSSLRCYILSALLSESVAGHIKFPSKELRKKKTHIQF